MAGSVRSQDIVNEFCYVNWGSFRLGKSVNAGRNEERRVKKGRQGRKRGMRKSRCVLVLGFLSFLSVPCPSPVCQGLCWRVIGESACGCGGVCVVSKGTARWALDAGGMYGSITV